MDSLIDGTMVDDTAAEVSYFPAGAWQTNGLAAHYNQTYHLTIVPRAYLTFRFNGSFVAYCSNLNTDHGVFFVSLDGRPVGTNSSYAGSLLPARALFTVAVEPGPHVLTVSNAATDTVMSLDYFITLSGYTPNDSAIPVTTPTQAVSTSTADSPSATIPAPAASISTADPSRSPLPTSYPLAAHTTVGTGAIVGPALAGGALLLLLIGVAVLIARRRRGSRALVEAQLVPLPAPLPPPYSGSSARSPSLPRGKVERAAVQSR